MTGEAQTSEDAIDATGSELKRLLLLVASLSAVAAVSYALPALERVRPWVAGEGVPIARMFQEGPTALPSFAEAGLNTGSGVSDSRVAEQLGDAVASNLAAASAEEPGAIPVPPSQVTPSGPTVRIAPSEYAGITQEIEHAKHLAPFFEQLARTAEKKKGAITRIAHYGDSSVAADQITFTTRRRMQKRFGDAGHGFILISRGNMHYGHKDVVHRSSDGWEVFSTVRNPLRKGWYGYGGVQARGKSGQHATFATPKDSPVGTAVSRYEVFYQRYRGGGRVVVSIDGERKEPISTRHGSKGDGFATYEVPDGPHSMRLRVSGGAGVRLYGVAMERDGPGVVYDSLGLVGARAQRLLNSNADHVKRQIAHRDPDLLVLGFGGNESGNSWLNLENYEKELVQVVRHMRAGKPKMPCLLFAPLDQGERNKRGKVVTIAKLPQIVEVQRKVAKREGCAFFDTFSAMGGEGSMAKWRKSRPRLATSDLRHATPDGYAVISSMYYKALLKAFAKHLAR
ncbi:MAG: GDSL-type esterase/lipase family protein [Myxococcales bacterium]|nr:GDSL-type esterase/lipase family protein [Myxococcales bacterium]